MARVQAAVTGVVLAGGKSDRMGQNKALMPLAGYRLVDRVVDVLQAVFADLLMVTNSPEVYADLGLPMVCDIYPEKGALGGIYSAIYHALTPHCFIVACDMPFLNTMVIRYLIAQMDGYDVVMPEVHGEAEPLHAIYGKSCLAPMLRRLEANRLKIIGFLPEVRVRTVNTTELQLLDPELLTFQNLNTPEQFQAAEQRLRP